ncbi:MAG: hypothetical protein ACM3N0_10235 [Chloroflexota bacterium]
MPESRTTEEKVGLILLAAAMASAVALLFWLQRDLAFADDSFNWIILAGLGPAKALIEPYGGHLILTPMLIYKAVLGTAGASYTAFGVIQVALLLILSALVYEYGRRRLGPLLALPAAIAILFLGSSSNVLEQPMLGIQFLCALVPGLAGLLALERGDCRGDVAACAFFALAAVGFEMGLAFVVGGAVGIALRDDRRQRAWIVAVPFLIYGVWRIWASQYGSSGVELSNVPWIPAYAVDNLGVVLASLFGLFFWVGSGQLTYLKLAGFDLSHLGEGLVLLTVELFAGALLVRRLLRRGPLPATLWVAVAVLVAIWIEQGLALAPNRTPGEVRYVFPDTVAFLLVALECARGIRATRFALIAAAAFTVAAVVGNLPRFKEGRDVLVEYTSSARASMAAMELDGAGMPPDFNPVTEAAEAFVPGREAYIGPSSLDAITSRYGRLGYSLGELRTQPEPVRETADIVAARGLGLRTAPGGAASAGCRTSGATGAIRLPPGGGVLRAQRASPLLLRRFASAYPVEIGRLRPGVAATVRIPTDRERLAWHAFAPDGGMLIVCPLRGPRPSISASRLSGR